MGADSHSLSLSCTQGYAAEAQQDCQQVDPSSCIHGPALLQIAGIQLAAGEVSNALQAAEKAQKLLPGCSDVWQLTHRLSLMLSKPAQQGPCVPDLQPEAAAAVAQSPDSAPFDSQLQASAAQAEQLVPLAVKRLPGEGRALCATLDVQPGTDLLQEPPFSVALAKGWANKVRGAASEQGTN